MAVVILNFKNWQPGCHNGKIVGGHFLWYWMILDMDQPNEKNTIDFLYHSRCLEIHRKIVRGVSLCDFVNCFFLVVMEKNSLSLHAKRKQILPGSLT